MIGDRILQFPDLQSLCRPDPCARPPRLSTVVKWAERQGIRYKYDGQGGIWTTLSAVERAVFDQSTNANDAGDVPTSELI